MTKPGRRLDLDAASRSALGWDELLDWVASFAATLVGARHIAALDPSAEPSVVERRQALLGEMGAALAAGAVVRAGSPDPGPALEVLAVQDLALDGRAARDLALAVDVAAAACQRLRSLDPGAFPLFHRLGASTPDLSAEAAPVLRGTDGEGLLLDEASPELRRLRERLARAGERLRRLLTRYLRQPGSETLFRDDFITQRSGRFVVPVRTDAPRPIRGIVHASSSSGATRFVEPLESVEPNNELVRLRDAEREEEQRILAEWTQAFRVRLQELHAAIEVLGRVDAWQARARFGQATDGVGAAVRGGAALRLEQLRHPLLLRRLREEQGGECVPSTIVLDPADRVLVLSGPNTGGKTVALKAIGLAALMAQSGIPVTAHAASLPCYRQLRADIGDHQSIQADLSTYSAHVQAIGEAIRGRRPTALFLFDELGTGTEPTEGAALARALLESLLEPGMTVVATTHLGPVKAWAVTAEGVDCAALDFDPETLLPSYRVVMGVAGRSGGLDIAERLGIEPDIVGRARGLLEPDQREGEDYLRRLRDAMAEAEAALDRAHDDREQLEREQQAWRLAQEKETAARAKQADQKLARVVDEFRRKARQEVDALREPAERARAERRRMRAERRLATEGARQRAEFAGLPAQRALPTEPVDPARLAVGDRVWVRRLSRTGEVRELLGREVDVRLGSVALRVRVDELFAPPPEDSAAVVPPDVHVSSPSRGAPNELVLVGQRVEPALRELDRFLDGAQLAGHDEVRVVHGHGTGRLRAAVRRHLDGHPQVRSHRPGQESEGGNGATVVQLG